MINNSRFTTVNSDEENKSVRRSRFSVPEKSFSPFDNAPKKSFSPFDNAPQNNFESLKPQKKFESPYQFQPVGNLVDAGKKAYTEGTGQIQQMADRQREVTKPLTDTIRKPFQGTMRATQNAQPINVLNSPTGRFLATQVGKTSGSSIEAMFKSAASSEITYDQAYSSIKQKQAENPSKFKEFLYQAYDTIPQTAIGVGISLLNPSAGIAYWTALSANEQIQEKGRVESLNPIIIDVALDKVLGDTIEGLFKSGKATFLRTITKSGLAESGTEVTQDLLKMQDAYLRAGTQEEKDAIKADAKLYFTSGQIFMTAGVAGLSGGVIGGGAQIINQNRPQQGPANPGVTVPRENVTFPGDVPPTPPPGATQQAPVQQQAPPQTTSRDTEKMKEPGVWNSPEKTIDAVKTKQGAEVTRNEFVTQFQKASETIQEQGGQDKANSIELLKKKDAEGAIKAIDSVADTLPTEEEYIQTNSEKTNKSTEGYKKMSDFIDSMERDKTIFPEDAPILKTIFEDMDDTFLRGMTFKQDASMTRTPGFFQRSNPNAQGEYDIKKSKLKMSRGLTNMLNKDRSPGKVFVHEVGHAGYYMILTQEERAISDKIFKEQGGAKSEANKRIFKGGFHEGDKSDLDYYTQDAAEFFAESFAEYIYQNKVSSAQMEPMLKRVSKKFFAGLKRLVNRKNDAAVEKLRPLYEKILSGSKETPLSEFAGKEPPSFRKELQEMLNKPGEQAPVEQAPVEQAATPSLFQGVEGNFDPSQYPETQGLFEGGREPVVEETTLFKANKPSRVPPKGRLGIFSISQSPVRVLTKMGLRTEYDMLKDADFARQQEDFVIEAKIRGWMNTVPSKESNKKIFNWLDGDKKTELTAQELDVAGQIKGYLETWADRLGLSKEARISDYISHIFTKDSKGLPDDIGLMIRNKQPGEVYNKYLLKRLGAEGYLKDTWTALELYLRRANRKVHLDPALKAMQNGAKKLKTPEEKTYVEKLVGVVNMRPHANDTLVDNSINKITHHPLAVKMFGRVIGGPRPVRSATSALRKMKSRSVIAGSAITMAKNLTQGVNTFSEIGAAYTLVGYSAISKKGAGQELRDQGVLLNSFADNQTYSAVKRFAEQADKILYANMNVTEHINRGAAYYGAKQKFLDGKVSVKDVNKSLNRQYTKESGYETTEADAKKYGKYVAETTQFMFGSLDTPLLLSSDVMKTAFQFQTFTLKQIERIGSQVGDKEWAKLARYILSSAILFSTIGKVFGMKTLDTFPFVTLGKPPIYDLIDSIIQEGIIGKDDYGNKLDAEGRLSSVGSSFLTNVVPAGAQIKRSVQGFNEVNEGASRTKSGRKKYNVEKSTSNYIRGTLFGKYNLPEAKQYRKEQDNKKKGKSSKSKSKTTSRFTTI